MKKMCRANPSAHNNVIVGAPEPCFRHSALGVLYAAVARATGLNALAVQGVLEDKATARSVSRKDAAAIRRAAHRFAAQAAKEVSAMPAYLTGQGNPPPVLRS